MSTDQVTTQQNDKVVADQANNVQPEEAVANKVVEQTEKPEATVEESKEAEPAVKADEETPAVQEKPVPASDRVESSSEAKSEQPESAVSDEVKADGDDKVAQPASAEEAVTESNGAEAEAEKKSEEPVDQAPVCKRKAENGDNGEVVEDGKSPKKAKVVDESDQAPVEETAA